MYKINITDKDLKKATHGKATLLIMTIALMLMYMASNNAQEPELRISYGSPQVIYAREIAEPTEAVEPVDISDYEGTGFLVNSYIPEAEIIPEVDKVWEFIESYNGSRIDRDYYNLLKTHCDTETLKKVVAISVSESGMGKALPHRQSNFWGWFLGGNKDHDPSREVMAEQICTGISKYYPDIHLGAGIVRYTGNDRPTTWQANFNWAYGRMQ